MTFKTIFKKGITTLLTLAIMIGVLTQLPQTGVEAASGTWNGGHVYKDAFWLRVDWSESAQNPKTNTSTVTATVYLVQKANYSLNVSGYKPVTIKIGSNTYSTKTTSAIKNSGGVTTKLATHTVNVTHNANGSLNVPISASYDIAATLGGTYFKTMSTSNTAVLDTLDRAVPTITPGVTNITANSVRLTGTANSSSDSWAYSKDGGVTWTSYGAPGTNTATMVSGLTPNTTYNFKVRARKTLNNLTGTSNTLSVTTAPAAATGLKVEKQSISSARLTWSAISGATSYNVYKNGALVSSGVKMPSYVFEGLISGVENTFSVSATNSVGTTGAQASVKFMLAPSGDPSNLKISGSSLSSMTLEWAAVPGAATYSVLKNNKVVSSGLKVLTYTYTGLRPGESATYGVRAENAGGMSGVTSIEFTVPPKEAPTGLGITQETDVHTTLSWSAVEGAESYNIYLDGNLIAESIIETHFNYENLEGATVHEFGVLAVNKGGKTPISTLEHATYIQVPSNLKITAQTPAEVSLAWSKQGTKIKHYNIYRDGEKIGESTTSSFIDTTYQNTLSTYSVSAVDLEDIETEMSLGVVVEDKEGPAISLTAQESSAISVTLKSTFEDALSGVNETSYKWAYGNHPVDYFEEKGNIFEGQELTLTRNGTLTVYAKDKAGNASVETFEVSGIIIQKVVGGFEHSETDLSIDAPGIPMEFSRFYDSTNTQSGPLGKGWRLSFMGSLELKDNYVSVTLAQGNPLVFEYKEGTYKGVNTYTTLTKSGTNWYLKDAYYTYTFNSSGALVKMADRNGNTVSIEVNDLGYPTKITDSVGRAYTLSYTDDRLTTLTDPIGRTLTYLYTNGNLTSVKSFKGEVIHGYDLDSEGRIISIKDLYNKEISTQTYDSSHRILSQTIEKETNEYVYGINDFGQQTITQDDKVLVYDNQGNVLVDEEGTIFIYDLNYGSLLSKKTSEGDETLYTYDTQGELITSITKDSENRITENVTVNMTYFEDSGRIRIRVETSTTTKYPEEGKPVIEVNTVTTTYDDKGNPLTIQEKSEDSDITMSNTFGAGGKITSSIDKTGVLTTFLYDRYGYPTQITTQAQNEDPVDTKYTSNSIGFVLKLESNRGVRSTFVYDELGNILKTESVEDGSEPRITRSVYNDKSEKIHEIGALEYNASQDILSPNSNGISNSDEYRDSKVGIRHTYNSDGKIANTQAGSYTIQNDSKGNVSSVSVGSNTLASYVYSEDEESLLKSLIYANGATLSYEYDDNGNRTSLTMDEVSFVYEYDEEDRIISKSREDIGMHTTYQYLENDDVKVVITNNNTPYDSYILSKEGENFTHFNGDHTYLYNYKDNQQEVYSRDGIEFLKKDIQKGKEGRKEKEVYLKGGERLLTSEYGYDAEGLITQYTNTYKDITFDAYQYEYDGYGNITKVLKNDKEIARYTYDKGNQLVRADEKNSNRTYFFKYDTHGNLVNKLEYYYNIYLYDLESEPFTDSYTYEYDNPNYPDQLTSINDEKITYDALGNPLSYRGWDMSWVNGRQLESMSKNDTHFNYLYDDEGIRIAKFVNDELITYTSVEGRITGQNDGTNNFEFHYDKDHNLVGFTLNHEAEYLYIKNVQNDIIGILDKDGNKVVSYEYDSWGKTISIAGSLVSTLGELNPMRYRSYYLDVETGLYYLQSRYYDPEVGRFISADEPSILEITTTSKEPLSVNLYSYCMNNPVNLKDPTGYGPAGAIIGTILGFGLGLILVPYIADLLKLRGWGRKLFIWAGVAAITALGGYIGYYVGEAIFKVYSSGGKLALKVNEGVARGIAKLVGGSIKSAQGNGWTINVGKLTLRVMTEGGGRANYFRLSHVAKGAMTILGSFSNDRSLTHIKITLNNIIKLIETIRRMK